MKGADSFFILSFYQNKMKLNLRTSIELAIWIIAVGAIWYGVYASPALREQQEIDNLKKQLAESIEREQLAKMDYEHCKVVMDDSHKAAEEERALQKQLGEQLISLVGLNESR